MFLFRDLLPQQVSKKLQKLLTVEAARTCPVLLESKRPRKLHTSHDVAITTHLDIGGAVKATYGTTGVEAIDATLGGVVKAVHAGNLEGP